MLDGTKAYVLAVTVHRAVASAKADSRRILAFRVAERFRVANTLVVLEESLRGDTGSNDNDERPMLIVDGGIENFIGDVDKLVSSGVLHRVRAQADIVFSNSMLEAFFRSLRHQYLFMNTQDTVAAVRRHVTFTVNAHNGQILHSALNGRTPDEVYFGNGEFIPEALEARRKAAQQARLEVNRSVSCATCLGTRSYPLVRGRRERQIRGGRARVGPTSVRHETNRDDNSAQQAHRSSPAGAPRPPVSSARRRKCRFGRETAVNRPGAATYSGSVVDFC